jgi:hypothetical protein
MATETQAPPYSEEDVGNIVLMEHVNVQVPDQSLATLFYVVGMGFTRDPEMMVGLENMWINLGEQQFHLPTGEPQALRGHTGIVTPSLDALATRLEGLAPKLEGTQFSWSRHDNYIEAVSPWGNKFRCYEPDAEFGNMRVGIPYVQFTVPRGTAAGIAAFYDQVIGAAAGVKNTEDGDAAEVSVGQHQRLIFQEADDVPDYDGHHIAVYIANFSKPYSFLSERGLITEDPRNHQFRFVDIVDPATNKVLFKIEHEVRGMKHGMFRRPLVNRTLGLLEPRRVGGQTVMGSVM